KEDAAGDRGPARDPRAPHRRRADPVRRHMPALEDEPRRVNAELALRPTGGSRIRARDEEDAWMNRVATLLVPLTLIAVCMGCAPRRHGTTDAMARPDARTPED